VSYGQKYLLRGPLGENFGSATFAHGANWQTVDVIPRGKDSLRVLEVVREEPDTARYRLRVRV
jgi:hypothetical protein